MWKCDRVDGEVNMLYPYNIKPMALVTDLVDNAPAFDPNRTGETYPGTPVYKAALGQDPARNMTHPFFSNMVVMSANAKSD